MIRIFTGENRVQAKREIERILGDDYELIEGENMELSDMPNVFRGVSLLTEERKILIKDLEASKAVWDKLPEYIDTPHEIVIWETKLDKRVSVYKTLKDRVEIREFAMPKDPNFGIVFDVYKMAKRDGRRAVEMLRRIEPTQEPMMFFGLMASQALKEYAARPGVSEKKALKELSKLDMELKSTAHEPWIMIESFLIRLASL